MLCDASCALCTVHCALCTVHLHCMCRTPALECKPTYVCCCTVFRFFHKHVHRNSIHSLILPAKSISTRYLFGHLLICTNYIHHRLTTAIIYPAWASLFPSRPFFTFTPSRPLVLPPPSFSDHSASMFPAVRRRCWPVTTLPPSLVGSSCHASLPRG